MLGNKPFHETLENRVIKFFDFKSAMRQCAPLSVY